MPSAVLMNQQQQQQSGQQQRASSANTSANNQTGNTNNNNNNNNSELNPDEMTDLEELEQFAKTFKQRRIKLGKLGFFFFY